MIGATGDDKVNLVVSLLAKTEFSVRRVVARINHPANEWLFTEAWGVDVRGVDSAGARRARRGGGRGRRHRAAVQPSARVRRT